MTFKVRSKHNRTDRLANIIKEQQFAYYAVLESELEWEDEPTTLLYPTYEHLLPFEDIVDEIRVVTWEDFSEKE